MVNYKTTCMTLACASLMLSACASKNVTTGRIPEDGLTVSQIYHQSIAESDKSLQMPRRHVNVMQKSHFQTQAGAGAHEPQAAFKALENPTIPIFVYPHVALIGDEQLLKPGFSTEFFLYKQNQYALASEHY